MNNQQQDLGLSSGRLAEIKLRLLDLPHTVWRAVGQVVERSSNRGDGKVAYCTSAEVARFLAHAPLDLDLLIRELEVSRLQIEKLREQVSEADRAALSARAELGQWRDRATTMRRAWRDFRDAMDGKQ